MATFNTHNWGSLAIRGKRKSLLNLQKDMEDMMATKRQKKLITTYVILTTHNFRVKKQTMFVPAMDNDLDEEEVLKGKMTLRRYGNF